MIALDVTAAGRMLVVESATAADTGLPDVERAAAEQRAQVIIDVVACMLEPQQVAESRDRFGASVLLREAAQETTRPLVAFTPPL